MQLRLIRFDLLILLLVSLNHVKTFEKLSPVEALTPDPSPTAMPFQQVSSSRMPGNERAVESPEIDGFAEQLDLKSRMRQERRDLRRNLGGKTIVYSPSHSETLLAEKLAKDALQSKETQDKIAELTSLKEGHKRPQNMSKVDGSVFQPVETSHGTRHAHKTGRKSKGHGKHRDHKKHKKHRKHGRKHRNLKRRLRRRHLKKESPNTAGKWKSSESISGGRDNRRRLEGRYRSEKSISSYRKKRSDNKLGPTNIDDEPDLIEGPPNFESPRRKYQDVDKRDMTHVKRSHIIAKLMQTTTRDPTKKKLGDQGIEYSEYYSDNDDILSPEIRARSKLDGVAKNSAEGQVRSVRETVEGNLLDRNYYDFSDEGLRVDGEKLKKNDRRAVSVMEDPSNSMEYVDNTYGPAQLGGVVDNDKISPYRPNYNYFPGNQFSPDVLQASFNQNSPVVENPLDKVPSNIIPSMANELNMNPMINNLRPVAQGQPGIPGNVVLSQLPQPQLVEGLRYSISNMSLPQFSSTVASSISLLKGNAVKSLGDINVNLPENEELTEVSAVVGSSSLDFKPTPSYDTLRKINTIQALGTPARGISAAPGSLVDNSLAAFNSPEILSRLQDIRHKLAPNVTYFSKKDGAEKIRAGGKIQSITSREVKKGKDKGSDLKKTDAQSATTPSEVTGTKKHEVNKASKNGDHKLVSTSCHAACTPQPGNKNDTKAVASEILTEIIEELEELKLENPKNEDKEGLPCRLTGSWVTVKAGVRIDMKVTNHSVQVSLDHLTSPISTEGLLNVTWNVTGFAPFKRGGPFTLLATNNHTKTLAVFVGACKVCQGIDTIEGSWTVSREPRDCRDFQLSNEIFNEIFRRTRLFSAIKDKQSKHEAPALTTVITPSGNTSTTESTSPVHGVSDNLEKPHNLTARFIGMQ